MSSYGDTMLLEDRSSRFDDVLLRLGKRRHFGDLVLFLDRVRVTSVTRVRQRQPPMWSQ